MIYFALLLVLTGLLILLLSVFSESGRAGIEGPGKLSVPAGLRRNRKYPDPGSIEIPLPPDPADHTEQGREEDIFIDFSDEDSSPHAVDLADDALPDIADFNDDFSVADDAQSVSSGRSGSSTVQAVLFDDRSNMIDYDSGGTVIDPTLAGYSSIKRVGSGMLEAEKDGLSFHLGDSLYRFDFHKVFDVWSGPNFVALPLKGSSSVKLFLLEEPAGFPDLVESLFSEYTKG